VGVFRTLAAGLLPAVAVAGAVAATGVAGCSSGTDGPKSIAVTHYRGLPPRAVPTLPPPPSGVSATWRGGRLHITTWGSGSCPAVPTRARARGAHAVEVTISADYGGVCTADLGPTTSVIEVPDGIAAAGPLTVTMRGGDRNPVTVTVPR
jgi:hypothetical protein